MFSADDMVDRRAVALRGGGFPPQFILYEKQQIKHLSSKRHQGNHVKCPQVTFERVVTYRTNQSDLALFCFDSNSMVPHFPQGTRWLD